MTHCARNRTSVLAAAAGAATMAFAAAAAAAFGAPPAKPDSGSVLPPVGLPRPGAPCGSITMPRGARLPGTAGCTVRDARYGTDVAAVVWALPEKSEEPVNAGVVVEDLAAPAPGVPPATRAFAGWKVPRIVEVRDVTGDHLEDVILAEREGDPTSPGDYFIFGRRKDGFGDLGSYPRVIDPKWSAGSFTGTYVSGLRDDPASWFFSRTRFERLGEKEKRVKPLRAEASSSAPRFPASAAVDEHTNTTWTEGKKGDGVGETLTVILPWKARIARVSFATGFDSLSKKDGDLFWLNNRITAARLRFDDGTIKNINVTSDARWVDYVPHETYETMKIVITIDRVAPGTKFRESCINEVEVYERVGK